MARLELNVDPTQAETGSARTRSALVGVKEQATASEAALNSIGGELVRLGAISESSAGDINEVSRALDAEASAFDRVRASLDPVFAAQQRFEQEQDQINRAVSLGIVTQEEANRVLGQSQARYFGVAQAADQFAVAQTRAAAASRRNSTAVTQLGFQVQDFAIQVASGQSALIAFTQQLPQALGAFGSFGRLALVGSVIGTVAAVALAAGPAIARLVRRTQSLDVALEDLEASTEAYVSAAREAARDVADLRSEFGEFADVIDRINDTQLDIARAQQLEDIRDVIGSINAEYSDFFDLLDRTGTDPRSTRAIIAAQQELLDELGLTRAEADAVRFALDAVGQSEGPEQAVLAADALNQTLIAVFGSADQIPSALRDASSEINQLAENAARTNTTLTEAERAALRLSQEIGEGAVEALRLAGVNLERPISDARLEAAQLAASLGLGLREAEDLARNLNAAADAITRAQRAASSLSLDSIGLEAQNAALREGNDLLDARARGLIAQRRAELADGFGSTDAAVRAAAAVELDRFTEAVQRNTVAQRENERQTDLLSDATSKSAEDNRRELETLEGQYEGILAAQSAVAAASISFANDSDVLNEALRRNVITSGEFEVAFQGLTEALEFPPELLEQFNQLTEQLRSGEINADMFAESLAGIDLAAERFNSAQEQIENLASSISNSFSDAFVDAINGAESFQEAFSSAAAAILADLGRLIIQQTLFNAITGAFGIQQQPTLLGSLAPSIFPNADGNAFSGGNVIPFANGGVVDSPTTFPMTGGRTGLMGEAGPEAIVPLDRTSNGRLGVDITGAPLNVKIINVRNEDEIGQYLAGPQGERIITNIMNRNR